MTPGRVFDRKRCTVHFHDNIISLTPQVDLKYLNEDGQTYTTWPVKIQRRVDENFSNTDMFYLKQCINEAMEELKKSIESLDYEKSSKDG